MKYRRQGFIAREEYLLDTPLLYVGGPGRRLRRVTDTGHEARGAEQENTEPQRNVIEYSFGE